MIRASVLFLTFLLTANLFAVFAADEFQTFQRPTINDVRLDWCRHWARDCGAPAANLFCQQKGYARAARFSGHPNLGTTGVPTVVFGDGRICQGPTCSGFAAITCVRPGPAPSPEVKVKQRAAPVQPTPDRTLGTVSRPPVPEMAVIRIDNDTTRYNFPKVKNVRLDWCRHAGRACGEPAAILFCRENGFDRASDFQADPRAGAAGMSTLIFGDGKICHGPQCQSFRHIVCTRAPRRIEQARTLQQSRQPSLTAKQPNDLTSLAQPVPLPRPRPIPHLPPPESIRVVAPEFQDLLVKVDPLVPYDLFTPLRPEVVAANWAAGLRRIDSYPEGAALFKCASGDCSLAVAADFEISPDVDYQQVHLDFKVGKVPHASGARWQASYLPFPAFSNGSDIDKDPPGLVATGLVELVQGRFSFDLKELATDLPPGTGQAIFYIRALPVATTGSERVVGQPSNVMKVYYGTKLPPPEPFTFYSKLDVPGSRPDVTLVNLKFEPLHTVSRWPPGCKTWEEKYGKEKKLGEKIGDFFSGAWNWASKTYQWAKDRVIEIASTLTLNAIPDNVLSFALDSALVSVGIPPDIPNLEEMMRNGVDGLAREMAKTAVQQVPTADLAANVGNLTADIAIEAAAEMAEDELRERMQREIERRTRQAILAAADEMEKQLREEGKKALCNPTTFHGAFHVTVRNNGSDVATDVAISAKAPPVYRGADWKIDLNPGETLTLVAVGEPMLQNGPYSHPLLLPKEREDEDMARWWNDIVYDERARIEVTLPGALKCLSGDARSQFCDRETITAHTSQPQLVTSPYQFSQ